MLGTMVPGEKYVDVMFGIRERFDTLDAVFQAEALDKYSLERIALHQRKIIESVAFACLIAVDNKFGKIPRSSSGQWNPKKIICDLQRRDFGTAFISPSIIRSPDSKEIKEHGYLGATVEGQPDRRLTKRQLIEIYEHTNLYLHELNPYRGKRRSEADDKKLIENSARLRSFVEKHFISIRGKAFFCELWDDQDNQTKVVPLDNLSA